MSRKYKALRRHNYFASKGRENPNYAQQFSGTHPGSNDVQTSESLTDSAIDVQGHTDESDEIRDISREGFAENRRLSHSQTPAAGDSKTFRRPSSSSAVHKPSVSSVVNGVTLRTPSFEDGKNFLRCIDSDCALIYERIV